MCGGGGAHVQKVLPCLEGGSLVAQHVLDPLFSPFCSPPLTVVNDRSLINGI